MTLKDFYTAAYKTAMEADPRGKENALLELLETKKEYEKITDEKKKKFFDTEKLENPYADSRVLFGDMNTKVEKVMCGIDLETQELLLIDRLNQNGAKIDLALSHHPEGHAYANFYEVMSMQTDIVAGWGVPVNQAEWVMKKRMSDIERRVSPSNHLRNSDAAKLLGIPYACLHTTADNQVVKYLTDLMEKIKPSKVSDVLDAINEIEEYRIAAENKNPPKLFTGSDKNRAGKVIVDMTGGTTSDVKTVTQLADAGVGTIIVMHLPEEHRKEAEKLSVNIVCAGHMASDSLGLNMMFKKIREYTKSDFEVIPCSGLIYLKR